MIFQIRDNACHEPGWTDSYLVWYDSEKIGYGSIKGNENITDRDTIFEFYIMPSFRKLSSIAFLELIKSSEARFIECQSNDLPLSSTLYDFGGNIRSEVILFGDHFNSDIKLSHILFRKRNEQDVVFEHKAEPIVEYVLEQYNEIRATGGFLLHYNMPFADLYMEVREDCRRRSLGSFLVQELKKQYYLAGRVPAARTGIDNMASRSTLLKAGFKVAGFMLLGNIKSIK